MPLINSMTIWLCGAFALLVVAPQVDAQIQSEEKLSGSNSELAAIYEADQADRQSRPIDWKVVSQRDSLRRAAVGELLLDQQVKTADDFYHAALVFQHGRSPESFLLANMLSREAARLDSSSAQARRMIGMTHDRYLWSIGLPQVYGTQSRTTEDGLWTFEPFDPDAVTDEERAAVGSLPLQEKYDWQERRNEAIRAKRDQ